MTFLIAFLSPWGGGGGGGDCVSKGFDIAFVPGVGYIPPRSTYAFCSGVWVYG